MKTIIFGSGGLIGSAILKHVPESTAFPTVIPWNQIEQCEQLFDSWSLAPEEVDVVWAAGASAVSATAKSLDDEMRIFQAFLRGLARNSSQIRRVLLISSAGGVYGQSSDTRITESTKPNPISDYGRIKLQQETALITCASNHGFQAIIARVANAYGPLQDLNKKQGLISTLVKASIDRVPVEVYVSLDTKRDYIFSDDIGKKIAALLEVSKANNNSVQYKIIASEVSRTVSSVVGEINRIRGIRTPVIYATKSETLLQPINLNFKSEELLEVSDIPCISLAEGLQKVIADQLLKKQQTHAM
jgi:UDP-glucose 4-epimerase